MSKKHSHYFKDVTHLTEIDVYRVLDLFKVTDPCLQHAVKKLLVAGGRGAGKDFRKDVQEAVDTLNRRLEMWREDDAAYRVAGPEVSTILGQVASYGGFPSFSGLASSGDRVPVEIKCEIDQLKCPDSLNIGVALGPLTEITSTNTPAEKIVTVYGRVAGKIPRNIELADVRCRHVFRDRGCNYKGQDKTSCNKTFESCEKLCNTQNFMV